MSKIPISCRREDSADVTGRIYEWLTRKFGRKAVFKDVDLIPFEAQKIAETLDQLTAGREELALTHVQVAAICCSPRSISNVG